ncbi:MAG: hypothetical protein LUC43_02295 [Burkholderiales bacterium]|nr:hypothetical protein [Burkholderiales bacterium]
MIKKLLVLAALTLSLGLIGCAPPPGPQGGPMGPGPQPGMGPGPGGQYGGPGGPGGYPPIPNSEPMPNTIYTSPAP